MAEGALTSRSEYDREYLEGDVLVQERYYDSPFNEVLALLPANGDQLSGTDPLTGYSAFEVKSVPDPEANDNTRRLVRVEYRLTQYETTESVA